MKLNFPYQSNTSSVYYDLKISTVGKAIYSVIVNEVTNCKNQPSQTLIASILGISLTTVKEHIKPLIEYNYINRYRVADGLPYTYSLISVDNGNEYKVNRNNAMKKAHEMKEGKDISEKLRKDKKTQSESDPVKMTDEKLDQTTQSESDQPYTGSESDPVLNLNSSLKTCEEPLSITEPLEPKLDTSKILSKSDKILESVSDDSLEEKEQKQERVSASEEDFWKDLEQTEQELSQHPNYASGFKIMDASQEMRKSQQRLAHSQLLVDMLRSNIIQENMEVLYE